MFYSSATEVGYEVHMEKIHEVAAGESLNLKGIGIED